MLIGGGLIPMYHCISQFENDDYGDLFQQCELSGKILNNFGTIEKWKLQHRFFF